MSKKVYLSLVFHNHQPVGNFDSVFRAAHDKSYLPLIELLHRHPQIKVGMHFSGSLRDWLLANEPFLYERLAVLVQRGQVEILGGAYYEPILIMLSDADKRGQMDKLTHAIEQDFSIRPRGMWLAERIWEPHLAKPIAEAGLTYTILDDTHFRYAGFKQEELYGYYVTEEQNKPLRLLSAQTEMRYRIPYETVRGVMNRLRDIQRSLYTQGDALVLMADDGEKFGMWPGSYQHCWTNGYMDSLFTTLAEAQDAGWLQTITPGDYVDNYPALGRAYLPTSSYIEMTEWALPSDSAEEFEHLRSGMLTEIEHVQSYDRGRSDYLNSVLSFMRGGFWRGFMVKYPEVNHMQKRGGYISDRTYTLEDEGQRTTALNHIWAAQSNCAYWHGVFGGIYLFHIRAANYAHLLEAQALITGDTITVDKVDFNLDGREELIVNGYPFTLTIHPHRGGAIFELDDLPSRYNLVNIMTRRREGYHVKLLRAAELNQVVTPGHPDWDNIYRVGAEAVRAREPNLERRLVGDWHRRGLLIDHFLSEETTLEGFSRAQYGEQGDFVTGTYTADVSGSGGKSVSIHLSRDGHVWVNGVHRPIRVEKRIKLAHDDREIEVEYTVTNLSEAALTLRFGVETAFGLDGGDSDQWSFEIEDVDVVSNLGVMGQYQDVEEYKLSTQIRGFELEVELDDPAELWRFPLEPVTMSEYGYESVHQGAVFLHLFNLNLDPGQSWHTEIEFEIEDLDD